MVYAPVARKERAPSEVLFLRSREERHQMDARDDGTHIYLRFNETTTRSQDNLQLIALSVVELLRIHLLEPRFIKAPYQSPEKSIGQQIELILLSA